VCEDGAQERRVGKHSNIECTLSRFSKLTKGGSTGSADTAEGVKKRICGRPQPRLAHRCLDLLLLKPVVCSGLVQKKI